MSAWLTSSRDRAAATQIASTDAGALLGSASHTRRWVGSRASTPRSSSTGMPKRGSVPSELTGRTSSRASRPSRMIVAPLRASSRHPTDIGASTAPGTAPSSRPYSMARRAVARAPERAPASTTTVAPLHAAIRRFRVRKRHFAGLAVGATSEIRAPPPSMTARKSPPWHAG